MEEAEDKISVRIEKEWDAVDKQCLRPLQVNQYCILVDRPYLSSQYPYRSRHICAWQSAVRIKQAPNLCYKVASRIAWDQFVKQTK